MFDPADKCSFPEREEKVLSFWEEKNIFQKSIANRRHKGPFFSFYDGPPFATGLPHYGHLLAGTIKDVIPRYKTMKGFCVPRRFGWDCHGLPIENEIEKIHQLSGAQSIEEFGLAKFNEECRKIVLRYTAQWEKTVKRMGRWVDFKHTYKTMDKSFMESVWWVFKQLYDKGLIYQGHKVMPFSTKLGTPLSNFEASLNYKEVDDPSLTIKLTTLDDPNTHFLAWTTTPWTLVANLAGSVARDAEYVVIEEKETQQRYILAAERLRSYFKDEASYTIVKQLKGEDLAGTRYEPLFPYFKELSEQGAFQILSTDFTTTQEGTGVVHTAPSFGEEDFYACRAAGLPTAACPVTNNGCYTDEVPEFEGMYVKDADKSIIRALKEKGKVFHLGTVHHRYPYCWRSDTPLIYRAMTTWFVAVEKIKERMLEMNQEIYWMPHYLKNGRFGNWLEGARDWAISRNRYWGTPIPIWRSEEGDIKVIGSIGELEALTESKIDDLHRHYVDHLTFEHEGKTYHRISEVFDCWFESGSMPYAQNHYPFKNKAITESTFPADFIAEGLDQTRGWFYTLHILSTALFDRPAFKNVIVNGIVLAEDGAKMSKRLQNYPDPQTVVDRYGADAVRLYMLHSPAVRADDLRFSEKGVELVLRQILIPWWNAYSFFITYARIYQWRPGAFSDKPKALIDQWILSLLHRLIHQVEEGLNDYNLSAAVEPFIEFINQLTNWYIRRSRRRFWSEEATSDREEAFQTLYRVLLELSKIAAPFVPFISDALFQNLRSETMSESVHLCDFPSYNAKIRKESLESSMAAVQSVVSLGHALRKEHKIKVRQPLPSVHIASHNKEVLGFLRSQQHLIEEELNVKEVHFSEDEHTLVTLMAKPNFRVLGKKVGAKMRAVQEAIAAFDDSTLEHLRKGNSVDLTVEGESLTLDPEDVAVERKPKEGLIASNEGEVALALDVTLNDELLIEGLARELVNKVNTMRREMQLDVSDRIRLTLETTERVKLCYENFSDYINGEVLAVEVDFAPCTGEEWDLNGEKAKIEVQKANIASASETN